MSDRNRHIENLKNQDDTFLKKGKIEWEKSEADVWAELEKKMNPKKTGNTISFFPKIAKWSVAAIFILLVGLGSVFVFSGKTVKSLPGEKVTADLPDGSSVELNAGSELKYNPWFWNYNRKLQFEGEGYFKVEKGERFVVESANGKTQVVGTSFNIYARDNEYRVTCLTGKVKVSTKTSEPVFLKPNTHVELEKGQLIVKDIFKAEKVLSWRSNLMFFDGRPLKEVIDEIERQFAVTIRLQPELNNRSFTSNFPKTYNVEEVLDIVCKSLQIEFIKQSENEFLVVKNS